jgi:hypothetical protein
MSHYHIADQHSAEFFGIAANVVEVVGAIVVIIL